MAHPVRLALLEALAEAGTLTATEAGEKVGESPANASFHLRQLAKYGFVEEAEGGTGRKRPWKLAHLGMSFTDVHEDQETAGAARALDRVLRDRYFARARAGLRGPPRAAGEWRAVTGINQMRLYLTPEELKAARRGDRRAPVRPLRRPARPEPGPARGRRARRDPDARLPGMRRLLAQRDARLFLAGQSLSLLGDTALWLALGLWAKDLTGSSSAAGLVFLCIVAPQLASPFAGLLVDRVRRRSLLLAVNPLTALAVLPLLAVHDARRRLDHLRRRARLRRVLRRARRGPVGAAAHARPARPARPGQRDAADRPRGAAAGRAGRRRRALHARGRRARSRCWTPRRSSPPPPRCSR